MCYKIRRIAIIIALKLIWGGVVGVTCVRKLKETMASIFFKYDEWKHNINYTELYSADPNTQQIRIVAGSDQQCGLDKIMTL
jgi:hypothetical protein